MEVRVRERLIGALVLVAIVVLIVPAVLKGPERVREETPSVPTRTVIVPLGDAAAPAQDDDLIPEPDAPAPGPATPPAEPPAEPSVPARRDVAAPVAEASPPAASRATESASELAPVTTPAWAVQLGAFSTRDKADGLVSDLRRRGYAAFVLEYRASGKVLHRVRVGPEQDRERAVAIAERLRKDGYQPVVAPHP